MNTKHYTHCPECGAKWIGDPIPLENRVNYRPPYFYYFLQEVWDWEQENLLEYECPQCRRRFPLDYDPEKTNIHLYNEMREAERLKEMFPCPDCDV